jgi:polyferredoxin
MVMAGIPRWLFLLGVVGIILLSFVAVEWITPTLERSFRANLLSSKPLYHAVKSRWFQLVPQIIAVLIFGFLIYTGLLGNRINNITPVAVWTIWWGGLIFAIVLLGPAFCFACPWDGLANLMTRFTRMGKVQSLSLALPFPSFLKNMYPAIIVFVLLTWAELGFGVTTNPRSTAYMGIAMGAGAIIFALLWKDKVFCKHLCPVGRINGIYANISPVEIRGKRERVCQACKTEDCLHGNGSGYACPTGISLKSVQDATYCTFCTECFKTCKKNNVAFNIRPFAADLVKDIRPRLDETWMALVLLSLTLFHGFSMTPAWENFAPGSWSLLKWAGITFGTPRAVNFTIAMVVVCAIPILLYWVSCRVAAWWTRTDALTLFKGYSFSLLAVALFYHLAHNAMHLFMEGGKIVPMFSDPMGRGDDYFGTAGLHIGSMIGEQSLWHVQVGLILTGHIVGIVVAHRTGRRLYSGKRDAVRSLVPMLVMMIVISICGLGLMHMDMNMRVGRM